MQTFAVSLVLWKPDGYMEHRLHVLEAGSVDAAEGFAMAQALKDGRTVEAMLSQSCDLAPAA